ncbi:c-type cytochrome [Candidatus Thiodiazotropha sp. CDECU1]|uniref:c-type cytochrome n=1 Tax=Candidatus Thiodiazotropha sp. CDECU1 TaxID=3065865 RepID=UPI002930F7C8|nr:c-type cytochrome [Candidatus Thiodiazotropha sp. CDECU1]
MADELNEDLNLRKNLENRIQAIAKNRKLHKQMIDEGRERTILCNTCHGKDGIAVQPLAPNLAGQNPAYIVDQFQRFGDGRRNEYLMSNLAKTFSFEDKIKIALYYADMEMKPSGGGNLSLLADGEKIYKQNCVKCHGDNGRGQEGYARLAGQRHDYVVKMLKEFRDRTGKRTNVWMSGVAIRLSDQDMDAVATYLANLK